jgi:hypothetical protein
LKWYRFELKSWIVTHVEVVPIGSNGGMDRDVRQWIRDHHDGSTEVAIELRTPDGKMVAGYRAKKKGKRWSYEKYQYSRNEGSHQGYMSERLARTT